MADISSVFLRHPGIAHAHSEALERKLKNITQGVERGWQRNSQIRRSLGQRVIRAHLVGREERYEHWFIGQGKNSASIVFPVDAETCPMCPLLPSDRIVEMIPPAQVEGESRSSDKETALRNTDHGGAEAEASRAVLRAWRRFARAIEEVRKTQFVPQGQAEHAGEPQNTLVGPSQLASPVGRIWDDSWRCIRARLSEGLDSLMRISDECRVRIREAAVEPNAELIAEQGARSGAAEMREIRAKQGGGAHTSLFVALPIPEEK